MNIGDQRLSYGERCMVTKGLLYYTDGNCDEKILRVVKENLLRVSRGYQIVSVSLAPVDLGFNVVFDLKRGPLTMFKQILAGLQTLDTDVVFLIEHDVLYPRCHFDFVPPRDDAYYYNENWWRVRVNDGVAFRFAAITVSGLCAYRSLLCQHYEKRVERVEKRFSHRQGYEPGLNQYPRGIDNVPFGTWQSIHPLVDIRHETNFTKGVVGERRLDARLQGGEIREGIPFWGKTKNMFPEFLDKVARGFTV